MRRFRVRYRMVILFIVSGRFIQSLTAFQSAFLHVIYRCLRSKTNPVQVFVHKQTHKLDFTNINMSLQEGEAFLIKD